MFTSAKNGSNESEYMKKTCLIVGDSLGLPRDEVDYFNTWPYLVQLRDKHYHFVLKFQRALTSKYLNEDQKRDWLEFYKPSIVILQLGIVDCAPRIIKKRSTLFRYISVMPAKLRSMICRYIKSNMPREARKCNVRINDFKSNIKDYLTRCGEAGVENIYIIK